ncbi:MAG: hypothetical protein L3K09_06585, partial [Thermoplasmata archaeon]|nr:hypothetical protein [Thermoplasmata archaeon]
MPIPRNARPLPSFVVTVIAGAVIVLLLLDGGNLPLRAGNPPTTPLASTGDDGFHGAAGSALRAAAASLSAGSGLAHGSSKSCSAPGHVSLCAPRSRSPDVAKPYGAWLDLSSVTVDSPGFRQGYGMTYDAADGYVVLVDGVDLVATEQSDTWTFSHGTWTQLNISSPSPRNYPGICYDAADGYVIMFGGGANYTGSNETWKFLHGVWTNLTPGLNPSPPARFEDSLVYDAADGYVVMFGGLNTTGGARNNFGDTWKYVAGHWSALGNNSSLAPKPRSMLQLAYDDADGYVVLYGGYSWITGRLNDTWTFSAGNWTELTPAPEPGGCNDAAMVYDATLGAVILGDPPWNSPTGGGMWEYKSGNWSKLRHGKVVPVDRNDFSMAWDPVDQLLLIYGGYGYGNGA